MADFDGDGKKDIAVFRPSNGTWYIQGSSAGYSAYQYGLPGDVPVPGDYNGYGRAGAAVFRPSNSVWFISPAGGAPYQVQFGLRGDIPVPGDYDGDGKTDVAVFRPSNGTWYVQGTRLGYWEYQWGLPGDIPVPADYDADGRVDAAVFRPSNNTWYVATSSSGTFSLAFGLSNDVPVASDFDGDGKADIAVFRPSNGTWYVQGTRLGYWEYQWGLPGDIPVPADYDADGRVDAAVFRPSNNTWYVATSSSGTRSLAFGLSGDIPLLSGYFTYLASSLPVLSLTNLTHPNLAPDFAVGDTYRMTITGAPQQPVSMVQTANGATSQQSFGSTDAYGHLIVNYVEQTSNIGSYTQVWSVGGVQASPAVSFMVGQLRSGGTVAATDTGATSDGHIEGASSISISNGTVTTYSVTELDYAAQAYYDAYTIGTLYENGTAIRSGSALAGGSAGGQMSAPGSGWKEYTLATDHYVVAYLISGGYYMNPYYYGPGTGDDSSGDVVFYPSSGPYYITAASIYLGSTIADQILVPQDGSNIPLVDDSAYSGFITSAGGSIPTWRVDAWGSAIRSIIPALFIAESVYATQHPDNPNIYPLPMILQLVKDVNQVTAQPIERNRTYMVRDTFGRPWSPSNPLRVDEILTYVAGSGRMPKPNDVGWTRANGEIQPDATMLDAYQNLAVFGAYPEVDFWHQYYASGFNAPGLSLPGVPGGPPISNAIPLMILSRNDPNHPTGCRYFGTLGIALRGDYVGINGDHGPNGTCPW